MTHHLRKILIAAGACLLATSIMAQRPKLDLKAYAGYHTHIFVYREIQRSTDVLHGWQGGFGFRVSKRRLMGEVNFNFIRTQVIVPIADSVLIDDGFDKFRFKFNAFELPLKAGYIPVKTPAFKWYVYTGPSFRFNTKGKLFIEDEEFKFKPNEVGLKSVNVDWLIGTQFDIYGFNIEVLYNIGVTNSLTENIRTNSHEILFNFGILF